MAYGSYDHTGYPEHFDYEDDGPTGPELRCQNARCRDSWHAMTVSEYQGEYPHGGMVEFLDDNCWQCPSCGSLGKVMRGRENGHDFDGEDEVEGEDREALYASLDGLEGILQSVKRMHKVRTDLPDDVRRWLHYAIKDAEQRYEYAIEQSKETK